MQISNLLHGGVYLRRSKFVHRSPREEIGVTVASSSGSAGLHNLSWGQALYVYFMCMFLKCGSKVNPLLKRTFLTTARILPSPFVIVFPKKHWNRSSHGPFHYPELRKKYHYWPWSDDSLYKMLFHKSTWFIKRKWIILLSLTSIVLHARVYSRAFLEQYFLMGYVHINTFILSVKGLHLNVAEFMWQHYWLSKGLLRHGTAWADVKMTPNAHWSKSGSF